jgi:hypothetical protein
MSEARDCLLGLLRLRARQLRPVRFATEGDWVQKTGKYGGVYWQRGDEKRYQKNRPGGGKAKKGPAGGGASPAAKKPAADPAKVKALIEQGMRGEASVGQMAAALAGLPQADVNALKKLWGQKAGGKKVEQARKLAEWALGKAPAPAKAAPPPKSEQEWRSHPTLAAAGDRLKIKDVEHPTVQHHLGELSRVPPAVMKAAAGHVSAVYVGTGGVPEHDEMGHVRGVRPRGWPEGTTWDDVAGAYNRGARSVIAGTGRGAVKVAALHEFGHGVDDAGRHSGHPDFRALHEKHYAALPPYFQQGGPGGAAGLAEMFAQAFAEAYTGTGMKTIPPEIIRWVKGRVEAHAAQRGGR